MTIYRAFFGFSTGAAPTPPTPTPEEPPRGTVAFLSDLPRRKKTEEEIRKEREDLGILPKAARVIEDVARSQAERLEQDRQKQLEQLARELEVAGIEWESRYLELLARLRERFIEEEIARLEASIMQSNLRRKQLMQILMIASVA